MDLTPYRFLMTDLARASGEFIRPFFGRAGLVVDIKADATPVTQADRGAEELMRGLIAKKFPGHGILGEEFGGERTDAEFVWVLDPIDGTKSFITGVPLWGTLIALLHRGQPVLGCIHQPVLGQMMLGDGVTCTLNGRAVRCRSTTSVENATLLTSDPFNPSKYQNGAAFNALRQRAKLVRTWGDCYGYLLVASGRADVMLDPEMNLWDVAALYPIITEAGGRLTTWDGSAAVGGSAVATNGVLHDQVMNLLHGRS